MFFDLLHRAQNGDLEAQKILFLEFERLIRKIAEKAYSDKEDCFQVLSFAFIKALPKFNTDVAITTYLNLKIGEEEKENVR